MILYHMILYYVMLCYVMLCYVMLYYIILYDIVLYDIILCPPNLGGCADASPCLSGHYIHTHLTTIDCCRRFLQLFSPSLFIQHM